MYEPINQLNTNERGFMALITAILISASLLILTLAVSFEGYFSRLTIVESDSKERSTYLAEACVNTAILRLSQDTSDTTTGPVTVGNDTCVVDSISVGTFPSEREIGVQGSSTAAVTNLVVEVDTASAPEIEILSWTEVATLP